MKHKILLALFLCLLVVFSSKIILLGKDEIVQVKDVSSNIENYSIENIKEEKENLKIDIYYPVTKYENINLKIMQKIEEYIVKVKNSEYVSNNKYLKISFEEFKKDDIISLKFNVEYNEGLTHNTEDVFTIVFNDENVIDIDYLKNKDTNILKSIKENALEILKSEIKVEDPINKEALEKDEVYSNFIIVENKLIIFFNKNVISGNKSNIIAIEMDNSYI